MLAEIFRKSDGKEKLNKSAFARKCGIEQSTMAGYLSGKSSPTVENAIKIAKGNEVSLIWLTTGEGPMFKKLGVENNSIGPSNISPGPSMEHARKIPVISWVKAGEWQDVFDPYQPGFAEDWVLTTETNHPNAFALTIQGDSMEPEFLEGDIVTVDPGRDAINGSYVVAKNGEEATFKQLVIDGSNVYLKPLNTRYPIKDITGIEIKIVGVVVEKRKRY